MAGNFHSFFSPNISNDLFSCFWMRWRNDTAFTSINTLNESLHYPLDEHLPHVINACKSSKNDISRKGIAAIQQLTKNDGNKKILAKLGVLKVLTDVILDPKKKECHRYAVVTLFRIVSNNGLSNICYINYFFYLMCFGSISVSHYATFPKRKKRSII